MDHPNVPMIHAAVHAYIAKKLHPSDFLTWAPIPGNSDTDTQPTSACKESYGTDSLALLCHLQWVLVGHGPRELQQLP